MGFWALKTHLRQPLPALLYLLHPCSRPPKRAEGRLVCILYDPGWLTEGFDLSPSTLPFESAPVLGSPEPFSGLHGVFNDSLPDGWGLLLMDRALRSRFGWSREDITPLDRLAYMGDRGMGALEWATSTPPPLVERVIPQWWTCCS